METPAPIKLSQPRGTTLINMGVAALIVAGLYFGREIFVPVALAVLLSFVLAPFVSRLQSLRFPRVAAVLAVVILGFAIIFSLGGLMVSQASRLAGALPGYEQTLRNKIESLRGLTGGGTGTLERASKVLKELKTELQNSEAGSTPSATVLQPPADSKPIPVEVRQPDPGALTTLVAIIAPLVSPLTTTGIVVIFVIFILLQRQDLRNRFVRLAGSADIQRTTALVDDLDGHEDIKVIDVPSAEVASPSSPLGILVTAEQQEEKTPLRVWQGPRSILCIPGYTKLDESAAIVLAQGLRRRGYGAAAEPSDALSVSKFFSLDLTGTELVCICYVDRPSNAKLHYAIRRLTKKSKSAHVMVLLLGSAAEAREDEKVVGLSAVTNTFEAALDAVGLKAIEAATAIVPEHSAPSASAGS
jgi:hypothetical protein